MEEMLFGLHSQPVSDTFLTQEPDLLVTDTFQVCEAAKVHIIDLVKHHQTLKKNYIILCRQFCCVSSRSYIISKTHSLE